MNKEETIKLFHQGRDAWNIWAWTGRSNINAVADFQGHVFEEEVDFSDFRFPADALFNNVIFKKKAIFQGCIFEGNVDFSNLRLYFPL